MVAGVTLCARLRHVRWIGGGSGAGKSTVARHLGAQRDLVVYDTDAVMGDHVARAAPSDAPGMAAFAAMTMDRRWVERTPHDMLESFHWYRGEGFDLIVEDLLALPRDRGVVVEGFRLLPELVAPLMQDSRQGVWLLPSPAFRRAAFTSRGDLWTIAGRTSDPATALSNLLQRDGLFTERLREQTRRLDLPVIEVAGDVAHETLAERVAAALLW